MFPELFRIPFLDLTLSSYGLLLAVAFVAALYITARVAASDGLNKSQVYDVGLYILIASLIGSKIAMVITEWPSFREAPRLILSLDFLRSGGVFYGGLIGAVIAAFFLIRWYRLPWWRTADAFAVGIPLGHTIGRLGCFSAGCCWGKSTTSWIGVQFTERGHELTGVPVGVALHPTQLYEAAANLALFFFLFWFRKKRSFDGQIVLLYGLLYSIIRFVVEIWRDDPRGDVLGLTSATGLSTSQLISLILGSVCFVLLVYLWRRTIDLKTEAQASGA